MPDGAGKGQIGTEYIHTLYGVTLGDGGKNTLVRGVWIKNRGLFTLGSPL